MPKFTIEASYRMPYYRQRIYDAATPEKACRLAIEDEDWSGELPDYECAGPTYITGIWRGTDSAYEGDAIAVPSHFDETGTAHDRPLPRLTRPARLSGPAAGALPG